MEYDLNGRVSWTGDLLTADTEDLKAVPPSEYHEKKVQIQRVSSLEQHDSDICNLL